MDIFRPFSYVSAINKRHDKRNTIAKTFSTYRTRTTCCLVRAHVGIGTSRSRISLRQFVKKKKTKRYSVRETVHLFGVRTCCVSRVKRLSRDVCRAKNVLKHQTIPNGDGFLFLTFLSVYLEIYRPFSDLERGKNHYELISPFIYMNMASVAAFDVCRGVCQHQNLNNCEQLVFSRSFFDQIKRFSYYYLNSFVFIIIKRTFGLNILKLIIFFLDCKFLTDL